MTADAESANTSANATKTAVRKKHYAMLTIAAKSRRTENMTTDHEHRTALRARLKDAIRSHCAELVDALEWLEWSACEVVPFHAKLAEKNAEHVLEACDAKDLDAPHDPESCDGCAVALEGLEEPEEDEPEHAMTAAESAVVDQMYRDDEAKEKARRLIRDEQIYSPDFFEQVDLARYADPEEI